MICILQVPFLFLLVGNFALAARPKPAFDCDDDKIDAKYYNEPCSSNEDCFGRYMHCQSGKCECVIDAIPHERFVGEKAKQTTCDRAPDLNEKCNTTCLRPLKCVEKPVTNGNPEKVCLCQEPYKIIDGDCELECKDDEKYDRLSHTCQQRCRANEVEIDKKCAPVAKINEACQKNEQCHVAFSDCQGGKCACKTGLSFENGQCVPEKVNCPVGPATMRNNKPIPCIMNSPENCPEGSVCQQQQSSQRNSAAFCCPEVPAVCPIGVPHAQFTCDDRNNTCPYESHFCHSQPGAKNDLCCPKPCQSADDIYHEGKCYPSRTLGDFCDRPEQCPTSSGCRQGRCRCLEGFTQQGGSSYQYCEQTCQKHERLHDGKCHKILSLGDNCENQPWLCPVSAFCNKYNVCACRCPFFTLIKDVCAPLPRCPGLKPYHPYPGRRWYSLETAADKGYQPISDADRQKTLENVTFCTFPPVESALKVDAVADCGAGKYCARYMENLGMCCKTLETVCPNGKAPAEKRTCNRNDATTCRANEFCYQYLYTASSNTTEGTMCCPKAGLEEEE